MGNTFFKVFKINYLLNYFLLIGCFLGPFNCFAQDGQKASVQLTEQELSFIKAHPSITLGSGDSVTPFSIKTRDNKIEGFDADILALISQRTGLDIKLKVGNRVDIQKQAKEKLIDGLSGVAFSKEDETYYFFSKPYIKLYSMVVAKDGNPKGIYNPKDLEGKTVALQRGNLFFQQTLKENMENVNIQYYDTLSDLMKAVVSEEVDFTILDASFYYLATLIAVDELIETRFILGDSPTKLYFATRHDQPEINSIINKGLASISSADFLKIHSRWFAHNHPTDDKLEEITPLIDSENNYLDDRDIVEACVLEDALPLERISKSGEHEGMGKDLLSIIESRIGIQTKIVPIANQNMMVNAISDKLCDIKVLAQAPKIANKEVIFTTPIIEVPIVIFAKSTFGKIDNLAVLKGTKLAVLENSQAEAFFEEHYPYIQLVKVKDQIEGLNLLIESSVSGFAGLDIVTRKVIQTEGIVNLHIIATLPIQMPLSIASHADDPHLHNILQKVVNLLSDERKDEIYQKWDGVTYDSDVNYILITSIILGCLVVIVLILIWTNSIRHEKNKTKNALNKLELTLLIVEKRNKTLKHLSITDPLTNLSNRIRLNEAIDDELKRTKRWKTSFGLMIIDIDHFKAINDNFGHLAGDDILVSIAQTLTQSAREIDTIGRWGGEEFVIICPQSDRDGVMQLAERLRKNVMEMTCAIDIKLTVSVGVAMIKDEDTIQTIVSRADTALYEAKNSGRNKVCIG